MTTRKLHSILGFVSLFAVAWHPCSWAADEVPSIPQRGKTLQSFVPSGYKIGIQAHADFNGDGREDIAALLWVSPDSPAPRPFIILLRQADGSYRLSLQTDKRFTDSSEADACGGGNWNCVPNIVAKNGALVISMPWGSAAGYDVYEKEFRLRKAAWYLVREAVYSIGGEQSCPEQGNAKAGERCFEQGVSNNLVTGIGTRYWKFVDDDGKETRVVRIKNSLVRRRLKQLTEVTEWEDMDQK